MFTYVMAGGASSLLVGKGLEIRNNIAKFLKQLNIDWLQQYDQALEKAYMTSGDQAMGAQLVMAVFSGSDWCPHCQDLTKEVFDSVEFRLWFNHHLIVPLLLDYPLNASQPNNIQVQNAKLKAQYNIEGFPTAVAIKASGGYCIPNGGCVVNASDVGRVVGYMKGSGADNWIKTFSAAANIK